jgi:hypothetical protein
MLRKRLVMIAALLLGVGLGSAPAWGARISISPSLPSSMDSIKVTVRGVLASGCWDDPGQASCSMIQPDTLLIQVSVNYWCDFPGCRCSLDLINYVRACTVAPLAPGTYVAKFVELHINPADPLPTVTTTAQLTVSESTPALRRSWGVLKLLYR